ncbi:MAG: AMP-binding protein, partial [Thermoleophilaceae bacterium]
MPGWNFASNIVESLPRNRRGLVGVAADGSRREWTFGEIAEVSCRVAGTLQANGVRKGDQVVTLLGNTPEWVFTLTACWRIGAVAVPCNQQLRPHDLEKRLAALEPRLAVADEEGAPKLAEVGCDALRPDALAGSARADAEPLQPDDPALVIFTSGTAGDPKPVRHGQRYLAGQAVQAEHWFGAREGDLCWCTAASGWSKSARNAFVAPWIRGAAAL